MINANKRGDSARYSSLYLEHYLMVVLQLVPRSFSGHHLMHDASEAPDVGGTAVAPLSDHFRRHVS